MLISFLLSVFEFILSTLLTYVSNVFPLFSVLTDIFYLGLGIISQGMTIVSFFFNPGDLVTLCDIWIMLFFLDHTFEIIFFVLRKIPFLNIK